MGLKGKVNLLWIISGVIPGAGYTATSYLDILEINGIRENIAVAK
jgi:hypothetical protein